MSVPVTILGAGAGGRGLSVHLALRGARVTICDRFPSFLDPLRGGEIAYSGALGEGVVRVTPAEDPVDAVRASRIVFLATTAVGQEWAFGAVGTAGVDDLIVVVLSGCMGSLLARRLCPRGLALLGESSAFPMSARITPDGRCQIRRISHPRVAAFPGRQSAALVERLGGLIDAKPADTIVETCLCNPNPQIHAGTMLLNFAHIERHGMNVEVPLEGITPKGAQLIDALDLERRAIGDAYGYGLPSIDDLYQEIGNRRPPFREPLLPPPQPLEARFLTEDVPFGLALWVSLAEAAGIRVPLMSSILHLFRRLEPDLRTEERSLAGLGLDGLAPAEVTAFLLEGSDGRAQGFQPR